MMFASERLRDPATPTQFREAMHELVGGASIITTGRDGDRAGLTTTTVTSLSSGPPTLLLCLNQTDSILPLLQRYWHFAVNVLPGDARMLAEHFSADAGRHAEDRFRSDDWTTRFSGAPILRSAVAAIECRLEELIPRHSHVIAIGRVLTAQVQDREEPLVQWRDSYTRLQTPPLRPD